MPIHFGISYYIPIVATPLEIMGSIFSVNMSSYEKMCALEELSTMNDDPSESNTTCSIYPTFEEIMCYILFFKMVERTKVKFLLWF